MEEDGDGGGRQAPPSCRAGVARMRAAGYARAETSAVLKTPGDPASGRSRQSDRPRSSRPARWRRSSRRHAARCWSSRNHHEQSSQLQRTRWADVATDTGRLTPRGYRPPARRRARRRTPHRGRHRRQRLLASPAPGCSRLGTFSHRERVLATSAAGCVVSGLLGALGFKERTRRAIALEAFSAVLQHPPAARPDGQRRPDPQPGRPTTSQGPRRSNQPDEQHRTPLLEAATLPGPGGR